MDTQFWYTVWDCSQITSVAEMECSSRHENKRLHGFPAGYEQKTELGESCLEETKMGAHSLHFCSPKEIIQWNSIETVRNGLEVGTCFLIQIRMVGVKPENQVFDRPSLKSISFSADIPKLPTVKKIKIKIKISTPVSGFTYCAQSAWVYFLSPK